MSSNAQKVQVDDRRSRRAELRLPASVEAGPGRVYNVTVRNISAHGVMLELDAPLVPGRPVTLVMSGLGRVQARVAWTRDGHVGIGFVDPLTMDQINAVL